MTWYRRKVARFPVMFAQPKDVDDLQLLVAYANQENFKITLRCSGHNITMPPLRNGAIAIDLSLFKKIGDIDTATKTVWAEPSVLSQVLNQALFEKGLVFPWAHTGFVSIGGFLLGGGGMGWNMPAYGMGCSSVLAAELMPADGRVVTATPTENADLYCAMRGAGQGFFAIVLRYKLQAHDAPVAVMNSYYVPIVNLDAAIKETLRLAPILKQRAEILGALGKFPPPGTPPSEGGWYWLLNIVSYGDNEQDALEAANILNQSALPQLCKVQTAHNKTLNYMQLFQALGATDAYSNFRTTETAIFIEQPAEVLAIIADLLDKEAIDDRSFGFYVIDTNPTVSEPCSFTYWAPHYISFV